MTYECQSSKDIFEYHVYNLKHRPHVNSCRDILVTPTEIKGTKWSYVWREITTGDLIWSPKETHVSIACSASHLDGIQNMGKKYKLLHLSLFTLSTREALLIQDILNI